MLNDCFNANEEATLFIQGNHQATNVVSREEKPATSVYPSPPVSLLIPLAPAVMEYSYFFYCCPDLVQNKPPSSPTSTQIYRYLLKKSLSERKL